MRPDLMAETSSMPRWVWRLAMALALAAACLYADARTPHFVYTNGTHFMLNKEAFYVNGANFYWLMYQAADPSSRPLVTRVLEEAVGLGLTVGRTWAFNDGGYRALQLSPGHFDENVFQALDFVISEAARYQVRLILSLVNNYDAFGGKKQYVQWARDAGVPNLNSEDDFFWNPTIRDWFKNYIQVILTRKNTITGLVYANDPTIFAWELMNEPRCLSDPYGNTLQAWIDEMSSYVKTLDSNHLLEVGLEGFYNTSAEEVAAVSAGSDFYQKLGTDFIRDNLLPSVDFATVHAYSDFWFPQASYQQQLTFLRGWISHHITDAENILHKPVLFTEFGKNSNDEGFTPQQRDEVLSLFFDSVYGSAQTGGAGAGALFWHLFTDGMDNFNDGYQIIPSRSPSTATLIVGQSQRLTTLRRLRHKATER